MKMFNKRGITMVALVITITVSLILTAAVVMTGSDVPETAELATFYSDIATLQETVRTQLMINKYKNPNDPNAENNKWIGIIAEDSFVNEMPVFDIPLSINGTDIYVAPLSYNLLNYVSMSEAYLDEFFVDSNGTVYNQGKSINGVTYYTKTDYSGSQVGGNSPVVTRYVITLITNGGTINSGNITRYVPGTEIVLPTNVTKVGNVFDGWYNNNEFTGESINVIDSSESGNKTFYAKWNENGSGSGEDEPSQTTRTVTLYLNGGMLNPGSTLNSYVEGVGATLPTEITKSGYTFGGWYITSNFIGNAVSRITSSDTGNKAYYAKWTQNEGSGNQSVEYAITLYVNGGTINSGNVNSYLTGTTTTLPTDITKGNSEFGGWYSSAAFSGNPITHISSTDIGNKVFYAKWNSVYNVSFNTNGGTINSGNITTYVEGVGAVLPTNVTYNNYIFNGWYNNPEYTGNAYSNISITDTGNKVFYAKWTLSSQPNTYTVTFDTNGGIINSGSIVSYTEGVGAVLPTNVTKVGYTFDGWYNNSACTGTEFTNITEQDAGNKVFYAKWITGTYSLTIHYWYSNGTVIPGVSSYVENINYGVSYSVTSPTIEGYTPNKEIVTGVMGATNKVVIVTYNINQYGVSLQTNGGTVNSGNVTTYVEGTEVSLPTDVTKTGHQFNGWYVDSAFSGNPVTTISTTDIGNKVFYAKWTVLNYTLTINYKFTNGIAVADTYVTQVNYGDTYSVVSPVVEDKGASQAVVEGIMGAENLTIDVIYAESFSITLNTNGGTINSGNVTSYNYGIEVLLPTDITKPESVFEGWYTNIECIGDAITKINTTDTGNKIFYAKWSDSVLPTIVSINARLNDEHGATYISGTNTTDDIYVEIVTNDNGSGIAELQWKEEGNNNWVTTGLLLGSTSNNFKTYNITFEGNNEGRIYFRAVDVYGNISTQSIENSIVLVQDANAPEFVTFKITDIVATSATKFNVKVLAVANDITGTGINNYQFKTNFTSIWTTASLSEYGEYTFTNLDVDTNYVLYGKVSDIAGNSTTAIIDNFKIDVITAENTTASITPDSSLGYTNQDVEVVLNTTSILDEYGYIEYSLNSTDGTDGTWNKYNDNKIIVSDNCDIYIRGVMNSVVVGIPLKVATIAHIDKTVPEITIAKTATTANITMSDMGNSGLNSSIENKYYLSTSANELKDGVWQDYTLGEDINIVNAENVRYYLFVNQVTDNANNLSANNDVIINNDHYAMVGPYEDDYEENIIPTVKILPSVGPITNLSTIQYVIQWSENVTGFEQSDINVTNGTITSFSGTDSTYFITVTNTGNVNQTIEIPANAAQASNSNFNEVGTSKTIEINSDELIYWKNIVTSKPDGYVENGDIITISSAEGLAWLISCVNQLNGQTSNNFSGKTVLLASDIDLSDYYWDPIGGSSYAFSGTFDGQNNTISGMNITGNNSYIGLFGNVSSATIRDLVIADCSLNGTSYCGLLAGNSASTSIENVSVQNSYIKATSSYSGGIVGYASSTFVNECKNDFSVVNSSSGHVGGIIGYMGNSTLIINTYSMGSILGVNYVGGIIGYCADSSIYNCYTVGNITGSGSYFGGIIGRIDSGNCCGNYFLGKFARLSTTGGIIGYRYYSNIISNYWNSNCTVVQGAEERGSLTAYSFFNKIDNECILDTQQQTCGNAYTVDLLTSLEMWNIYNNGMNIYGRVLEFLPWTVDSNINKGYPIFAYNYEYIPEEVVPNAEDGIYYISNSNQLSWIAGVVNGTITTGNIPIDISFSGKTIKLTNDITINNASIILDKTNKFWKCALDNQGVLSKWNVIGNSQTNAFKGTFDGNNKTVSGILLIDSNVQYQGMFGYCIGAEIKNLNVEHSFITGLNYVGAIAGYVGAIDGTLTRINNCSSNIYISVPYVSDSYGNVGGIVGYNSTCSITNCESSSYILTRVNNVGGIAGVCNTNSVLSNSISCGIIEGYRNIGGIVGNSLTGTTIEDCISNSDVYGYYKSVDDSRYYDYNIGGIGGSVDGNTIEGCINNGSLNGTLRIGGILGNGTSNIISNCNNNKGIINARFNYIGGIGGSVSGGSITNCINNVDIDGNSSSIGGIAGYVSSCLVTDCYNRNAISGTEYIGGICGQTESSSIVNNCSNFGLINGTGRVGGIIGHNGTYCAVETSYNYNNIVGSNVGGIVGHMYERTTIKNCGNYGVIVGNGGSAGGVCGYIGYAGKVYNCYNSGYVTANNSNVGGVVGATYTQTQIYNCYNCAQVQGTSNTGGIIGSSSGTVSKSYCIESTYNMSGAGGVNGDCYTFTYDNKKDVISTSVVKNGKIVMSDVQTLLNEWVVNNGISTYNTWKTDLSGINLGLPIHDEIASTYADYTEVIPNVIDGIYYINTPQDLAWIAGVVNGTITTGNLPNDKTFNGKIIKLNSNIEINSNIIGYRQDDNGNWHLDMSRGALKNIWVPIGNSTSLFKGTLDGNGYKISGVYTFNTSNFQGLFGNIQNATIRNLVIDNSYIKGATYVGALAGSTNNSTIDNVSIINSYINGSTYVGGLVGSAIGSDLTNAKFVDSTMYGSDVSTGRIGGIIGNSNYTNISNAYTKGLVYAVSNNTGGIIGYSSGDVNIINEMSRMNNNNDVYGAANVGGVIGYATYNDMYKCDNYGNVTGTSSSVSGIVGYALSELNLFYCNNNADVRGAAYTSGIVGFSNSTLQLSYCNNNNNIVGTSSSGGIVGEMRSSSVIDSSINLGSISGTAYIGGIVGNVVSGSEVRNSTNTSTVTATSDHVGGIAGRSENIIINCNNEGLATVRSNGSNVGGVVGYSTGSNARVIQSYNNADVSGYTKIGGVVGFNESSSKVYNVYNTGSVTMNSISNGHAGGIIGQNAAYLYNSYNTGSVTGYSGNVGGVVGYNTVLIYNVYNAGDFAADNNVGGICGYNNQNLTNCYWLDNTIKAIGTGSSVVCNKYTMLGSEGTLVSAVTINEETTTDLLTALNYWVENNESNPYSLWVEDTSNVNNGFPIMVFE